MLLYRDLAYLYDTFYTNRDTIITHKGYCCMQIPRHTENDNFSDYVLGIEMGYLSVLTIYINRAYHGLSTKPM